MIRFPQLTFGCDPEFFASYIENGKNYAFPPIAVKIDRGILPIWDDPTPPPRNHPIYIETNEYKIFQDGVAFEIGTKNYFKNSDTMWNCIFSAKEHLKSWLKKIELEFWDKPIIYFDTRRFYKKRNKAFRSCVVFGCDADEDAILPEYTCTTFDVSQHNLRYGGGHFHIGSEDTKDIEFMHKYINPFVKLLAIVIGNTCIANSPYLEEEKLRVFHYGKPGRFRYQKWGVEYRTPSNSWTSNKSTLERMMEGANYAFYLLQNPDEGKEIINNYLQPTIDAITLADNTLSNDILSALNF